MVKTDKQPIKITAANAGWHTQFRFREVRYRPGGVIYLSNGTDAKPRKNIQFNPTDYFFSMIIRPVGGIFLVLFPGDDLKTVFLLLDLHRFLSFTGLARTNSTGKKLPGIVTLVSRLS